MKHLVHPIKSLDVEIISIPVGYVQSTATNVVSWDEDVAMRFDRCHGSGKNVMVGNKSKTPMAICRGAIIPLPQYLHASITTTQCRHTSSRIPSIRRTYLIDETLSGPRIIHVSVRERRSDFYALFLSDSGRRLTQNPIVLESHQPELCVDRNAMIYCHYLACLHTPVRVSAFNPSLLALARCFSLYHPLLLNCYLAKRDLDVLMPSERELHTTEQRPSKVRELRVTQCTSEPGAAATARAKAAARIGAIGLGRPGLGRKRKRTQEPGGSHVSGEAETGQSTAAPAGLLGTGDLAVRSLSSLSNATDTRRASVRVVARATVPGASLSLGLLGLSNLSTAGGAPKDRANIVAGGLGNLDGKESEDPGTENDTEEDEDYAPAKVPRPYTGAGAGAARPVTSSSPNTTGIAPSLPQVASIPHTKSRAFPTPSSRGRRPRIPHSYRTSNHSNNNPNVTDMATFGFWTDAKKIVLFMHYLEDPEPSVEARRAMADQVALDTSQVSKFMSRTRSEIARGTMSERLKRLLRVAQDKVKARLVDGTESGATGDAVIHPPQGLADSSGSGSDVDAEFEVEVGTASASSVRHSTIFQVTQVPSHAELNGCQGKGEEECSSWRMDVDAASSEVALALLSLSASHGPSCSSSVISASLECDATTPDAAAVPSSPLRVQGCRGLCRIHAYSFVPPPSRTLALCFLSHIRPTPFSISN
ncbi:hypothetical protein BS47DRAFT_1393676 [Hydnum rufescens UP504]|uniref:Homeobox domain-containing protein n=1 Tax=Hydnum rufescens UP504 TaxID=1448309 RepID=A0A9P6AW70_9AGAM|nr:hypothetical protein BS47DRAFT_1393676 [Hydnum rufescens UP504]